MYKMFFPNGNAEEFCDHVFRTFDRDKNGFIDFKVSAAAGTERLREIARRRSASFGVRIGRTAIDGRSIGGVDGVDGVARPETTANSSAVEERERARRIRLICVIG